MAALRSHSLRDAWRGVLVALALAAFVLGGFYAFALGHIWHWPKPAPKQVQAVPRPEGSSARAPKDDDPSSPRASGPSAAATPALAPAANASDALRQVLRSYRADPKRTATASISSSGKATLTPGQPLTGMDGLPVEALHNGTMLSGAPLGR